ncbi:MAG: sorting protein [Verrucomicrobiales bacterium]|nr:sorting protein [Verrucomicrobiales bacterium]
MITPSFSPAKQLPILVLGGLLCHMTLSSLEAAPYASGDLLMGFVTGTGQGTDDTVVVRLGSASSFRDAFDTAKNSLNFANVGTQLSSVFGADWYERTDLYISIFASTDSDTIGDTLVSGDPFRTVYASRNRNSAGSVPGTARSTAWTFPSNTAATTTSGQIVSTALTYSLSTANAAGLAVIPKSGGNTLDEYTKPAKANSFANLTGGIEAAFAAGPWGSLGDAGSVEAALDVYRIQAVNNVSGQYGAGNPIRSGAYKGTFTISQTGQVSFIAMGNAPADGFNDWAVSKGLPTGTPTTDDRDNDGIPALVEYALDLNPLAFDSLPPPTAVAGGLQLAFTKGNAAGNDAKIIYSIESSSDLITWTALTPTINTATQISALLPSGDVSDRLFGRLEILKAN